MTLGRQLASAISVIFFVALVGVQVIHLRSAQAHLQQQLEALAQDAATSIGLSLGTLMRETDPALVQTVINPAFDRGHYERIEYFSAAGESLVSKTLPPQEGRYPAWFVGLFPLYAPTAQSLVSAGWRQLGRVQVTVHPGFAYEQLWVTARDTLLYLLLIYIAAMLALRVFLRGVLRPLAAVESAAQAISARNFVTLAIRPSTRELARVVEAMNTLSRKVNEAIESESRRAERLQDAAYRDELTGLLNNRGFVARFESIYEGEREPFSGVLAFLEVADLAAINREVGAGRCDALLRGIYRPIDELAAAKGGFAGRWTGALTLLAIPGLSAEASIERLTELRARVSHGIREFGLPRHDRVFCGGVVAAAGPVALRELTRAAEEALLRARESSDGIVVVPFAQAAQSPRPGQGDSLSVVREAVAARRVLLVGQGVYRMSDHRTLHTEIMARLRDASGDELTAAQFMPIVAAHGLGEEFDKSVIERVLQGLRERISEHAEEEEGISINVSIRSVEQAGFAEWLGRLLERDRAVARRLVFEVGEHGAAQNEAACARLSRTLAQSGAGFAIDHFGVHRDSLALLQRLRPVYIKLAAAHTPNLVGDSGVRFFAEALIRAARQLEIPVIAQNVEEDETFQSLGALGFAGYQGNLIDRPAPWPRRA